MHLLLVTRYHRILCRYTLYYTYSSVGVLLLRDKIPIDLPARRHLQSSSCILQLDSNYSCSWMYFLRNSNENVHDQIDQDGPAVVSIFRASIYRTTDCNSRSISRDRLTNRSETIARCKNHFVILI